MNQTDPKYLASVTDFLKKKVLRNFGIYFGANLLRKLIPFIFLPIITSYILPEEYGLWSLFMMIFSVLAPMMSIGVQEHINRSYFSEGKKELANQLFNILLQSMFLFIVLTLIFILLFTTTDSFLSIPTRYLLLIPFVCFADVVFRTTRCLLKNQEKALWFATSQIAYALFIWLTAFLLMRYFGWNWQAMIAGLCVSLFVISATGLFYLVSNRWLEGPFRPDVTKALLLINAPLVPHTLMANMAGIVDRSMLEMMGTTHEVGLYSVGMSYAVLTMLFLNAFILVWQPWFYKQFAAITVQKKQKIVRYIYAYIALVCVGSIAVAGSGYFYIKLFFSDEYFESIAVINWLAFNVVPMALSQMGFLFLNQKKKTWLFPWISGASIILNIILNLILLPRFGMVGAACATVLAKFIEALIVLILAHRYTPMPWLLDLQGIFKRG